MQGNNLTVSIKDSATKKKIVAVFGGSFNPPLNSHIKLAEKVMETNINIEKIIFVPVNSKYNKKDLISNEHRFNMLKYICDSNSKFYLSRIEIDNNRQLYTIETLDEVRNKYQSYDIYFILGTDNLKEFHRWKDVNRLLSDFKIIVIQRNNDNSQAIISENEILKEHIDSFVMMDKNIKDNLSSTYVRELIRRGEEYKQYMPEDVYNYINENQLYR